MTQAQAADLGVAPRRSRGSLTLPDLDVASGEMSVYDSPVYGRTRYSRRKLKQTLHAPA